MTSSPIRIGIVGFGQIARTQHVPVISASADFELAAIASPDLRDASAGVPVFTDMASMLDTVALDAVALCTPPQIRGELARVAAARGKHVMLEKPPAGTVAEAATLAPWGRQHGVTMFAAWHSVFSPAVAPVRTILAERGVAAMRISWKEDVEKWHPGATWFWRAGGMGVFDPAINAFSIVTAVLPEPVFVTAASFDVAEGAETPYRATLRLGTPARAAGFSVELDWLHRDGEEWAIEWTLKDGGRVVLRDGGAALDVDGREVVRAANEEYAGLYGRFAKLIRTGESEVDLRPLQLAADAFMIAGRLAPVSG